MYIYYSINYMCKYVYMYRLFLFCYRSIINKCEMLLSHDEKGFTLDFYPELYFVPWTSHIPCFFGPGPPLYHLRLSWEETM